jgi:hypothetical protein
VPRLKLTCLIVLAMSAAFSIGQTQQRSRKFTVEDYMEIQQLYWNYALAMDMGDGVRYAGLFLEDGEFTPGRGPGRANDPRSPIKGREALARAGQVSPRQGLYFRHVTTNIVITPTAEGANGSCYLLRFNAKTTPPTLEESGIYDDRLVKTAGGWKFKKRVVWRDDDDITPFKPKSVPQQ